MEEGNLQIIGTLVASRPSPVEAKEWRELGILLEKVKQFWVKGVLEKSVHSRVLLELGKEIDVGVVEHPWERVLELPNQVKQALPPDRRILDIFDEMGRALLILGEPGSGKTITLLELARDLINHAEQDRTFSQPIPVVFNLSSWTDKGQPLVDWMVSELSAKYQIPKRICRPWLENIRLLPLLDGLDEVRSENRAACVQTINHFVEEYGLAGLVVCSRLKEYTDLPVRLKLNGAIRLQPLTSEQVDDYLALVSPSLNALRINLKKDDNLLTLAESPLMLNIMSLAYQDLEPQPRQTFDTVETYREQLLDTYIERMFKRRRTVDKPYEDEQVVSWLSWLAQKMTEHNQVILLIEGLQPSWLSSRPWRWMYVLASRLIGGLVVGLIVGLIIWVLDGLVLNSAQGPTDGLIRGLVFGLFGGLLGGLLAALIDAVRIGRRSKKITVRLLPQNWQPASNVLLVGLIFGLLFGLLYGPLIGADLLINGLQLGLIVGPFFGLYFGLRGSRQSLTDDIQTVEALSWSRGTAQQGVARGLIYGLIFGLIYGLILGLVNLIYGWADWLSSRLIIGLMAGLIFVPVGGLIGATFGGLSSSVVGTKTVPNQGIRLSLRNAVFTGLIAGPVFGLLAVLLVVLLGGLPGGLIYDLVFGLMVGLIVGLSAALWYGGLDIIQHYTLRLILWYRGYTPRHYAHFLDYATERIFLQKVGGGHIFIHRLLMEHFASLDRQPVQANINRIVLGLTAVLLLLLLGVPCATNLYHISSYLPRRIHLQRGDRFAEQGEIEKALTSYAIAQELAPDIEISASSWNHLCWFGSLWGHATEVMGVCEIAVEMAPSDGNFRDSRGLARALTGDYEGAIEDFKFYVNWLKDLDRYEAGGNGREAWITKLESGQNPFNEATLEALRSK